jgi:hypothetical protein
MADEEGIPREIDELLSTWGIYVPEEYREAIEKGEEFPEKSMGYIYARVLKGYCMTCDGELGRNTIVCITTPFADSEEVEPRVVMVYCSGQCLSDMQVLGFLQESQEHIGQQVDFRGGRGGN